LIKKLKKKIIKYIYNIINEQTKDQPMTKS